jgi:methylase of polypeptide subunit release factors
MSHSQADVSVVKSDLLTSAPGLYDVIIANLPYVDREWERSPETKHEPEMALFAKNHGLDLILTLLDQTRDHQQIGGYILLEADPEQHAAISKKSEAYGYAHVLTDGYCLVFKRVR